MKHFQILILFIVFILVLPLSAEKINSSDAERVALNQLAGQQMTWNSQLNQGLFNHVIGYTIKSVNTVTDGENGDTLFYVFNLNPDGFVVVSADTAIQPVIAYSYFGSFPMENTPGNVLLRMLQSDTRLRMDSLPATEERVRTANSRKWAALLNNLPEIQTVEQWPPVEHSQYNSGWLFPGTFLPGTTLMSHIDNYWQAVFPISLPGGDEGLAGLTADTAGTAAALKTIYGYNSAREIRDNTSPLLLNTLADNMRRGWPAQLEIHLDNRYESLYIISDGYRSTALGDSYYHLDFGSRSGIPSVWYALPQGMPAGFSIVDAAVLDICPTDDLYEPNDTLPEAYPVMDNDFNENGGLWETTAHKGMEPGDERDWYRFEAKTGDELTITSRSSASPVDVSLYKGAQLIETEVSSRDSGQNELSHRVTEPGTYFISVSRGEGTPVDEAALYKLQIQRLRETPEQSKLPQKVLVSLYISGPSSVDENSSATYTATAYYDDDTYAYVSSYASWSVSPLTYAEMFSNTLYTDAVSSNQTVTVSATYSSGGVSRTANKTVTIVNVALDHITVSGATSLMENTSTNYTATAYFTNGSTSNVTASASWSENSDYATMSGNTLNAGTVPSHQGVRVTASYTNGGITRSSYIDVTIINFQLNFIIASGPGGVWENSFGVYYATAYFTDGSSYDVTYSCYWTDTFGSYAYMAGNWLYTNSVPQTIFGGIWVDYTYGGITKTDYISVWIYDN